MTPFVRTLGGDIAPDLLGPVLAHEHLVIDSPLVSSEMPHIHLPSVEEAVRETSTLVAAGVRTMVDAMPAGAGRDPEKLARVSVLTGMKIVAATGLHTDKYYVDVDWESSESPEQLAQRFIDDIETGIDPADYRGESVGRSMVRAGVIKVATSQPEFRSRDVRLFEAAVLTHQATGAPILTHTEAGRGGVEQVAWLVDAGVSPGDIAISHTDKVDDVSYHASLLEAGVYLCYDQALRAPDVTQRLVEAMQTKGFANQLLIGTDGARRSLWSTLGGAPGLASIYDSFRSRLDDAGQIFVDNPARWLTFRSDPGG